MEVEMGTDLHETLPPGGGQRHGHPLQARGRRNVRRRDMCRHQHGNGPGICAARSQHHLPGLFHRRMPGKHVGAIRVRPTPRQGAVFIHLHTHDRRALRLYIIKSPVNVYLMWLWWVVLLTTLLPGEGRELMIRQLKVGVTGNPRPIAADSAKTSGTFPGDSGGVTAQVELGLTRDGLKGVSVSNS